MPIKIITPAAQALTLAELRAHVRIDPVDAAHPDDGMLQAYCLAAQSYADHYTGISTAPQTLELALDGFPDGAAQLPQGPVQSIESVKYFDAAGVEQTLASSAYALDDYSTPQWIMPAVSGTWPDTIAAVNAVKVRYLAGHSALHPAVRAALLLIVGHLYANRESVAAGGLTEVPMGAHALLDTVRDWSM